jgi:hypothetical protein
MTPLLLALPIILLLFFALVLFTLRVVQPKFSYFWLIAALGALLAWPAQLINRVVIPAEINLAVWQPGIYFRSSPGLLLDEISWPFALALVSLVLGVILTDVARAAEADWLAWASSLAITALGLVAVLAGNPLTLMLAWAALDLAEVLILLSETLKSSIREQIIIAYATRIAGILFLLIATLSSSASGLPLSFESITPAASLYLLLAAGLRLGVLPMYLPLFEKLPLRRGLGTLLNLVPAATSLMLLARTAAIGAEPAHASYLFALAGLAGVYAGLSWLTAVDELEGRPFWILGLASLAFASAVRSQPSATLAIGITTLLSGGLIFLFSARHRLLYPVAGLGFLGILGLPYLPSWQAAGLYKPPFNFLLVIFLIAQTMLAAGYLRHLARPSDRLAGVERWVWVIYPWGLVIMPLTHILLTVWGLRQPAGELPDLRTSWPNFLIVLIICGFGLLYRRGFQIPVRLTQIFRRTLSLHWLYRFIWQLYRLGARFVAFINLILEGEGGILWTLLLLVILLSLLAQQQLGG